MSENIRILIADDHAVVRRGLRAFIDTQPDMEVVGEASDGVEAVEQASEHKPDVILLDMVMPGKDGPEVIADIKYQNSDAVRGFLFTSCFPSTWNKPAWLTLSSNGWTLSRGGPVSKPGCWSTLISTSHPTYRQDFTEYVWRLLTTP